MIWTTLKDPSLKKDPWELYCYWNPRSLPLYWYRIPSSGLVRPQKTSEMNVSDWDDPPPPPWKYKFITVTLKNKTVRAFEKSNFLWKVLFFLENYTFPPTNYQTIVLIWKFYREGWREHKRHRKWTFQCEAKTPWKSESVTLKNKKVRAF